MPVGGGAQGPTVRGVKGGEAVVALESTKFRAGRRRGRKKENRSGMSASKENGGCGKWRRSKEMSGEIGVGEHHRNCGRVGALELWGYEVAGAGVAVEMRKRKV